MKSFARQLREAMNEAHLNQTTLAAMVDISNGALSGYLSGKLTPPQKKQQRIALALGKPSDFFLIREVDTGIAEDGGFKLSVKTAASLMGINESTLRIGLQNGVFPFGYAIKTGRGTKGIRYTYWISRIRFTQETGIPVPLKGDKIPNDTRAIE